jgi:hypothetical protein
VQHFESPREDLSSDIKSEDDDFSRDDNLNHGVDGLMNHFNMSQSLKHDSNMELKLPLIMGKPIRIQEGMPLLSQTLNQKSGLKTTTTAELKLKPGKASFDFSQSAIMG